MIIALFKLYIWIKFIEMVFSQPLRRKYWDRTEIRKKWFYLQYEEASFMKSRSIKCSESKFRELLDVLDKTNIFNNEDRLNIKSKVYFHLATLVQNGLMKQQYLTKCLNLNPHHQMARKLFDIIIPYEANYERSYTSR